MGKGETDFVLVLQSIYKNLCGVVRTTTQFHRFTQEYNIHAAQRLIKNVKFGMLRLQRVRDIPLYVC